MQDIRAGDESGQAPAFRRTVPFGRVEVM